MKPKRPGGANAVGGGCLMAFSLPFIGFGGAAMAASIVPSIPGAGYASWANVIIPAIFGLIFTGVGLVMFIAGLRAMRTARGGVALVAEAPPWDANPLFPKFKQVRGRRGFRLSPGASALAKAIGLSIAALIWNGISWGALFFVVRDREFIGMICVGIFGLIGLLILYAAGHAILGYILVGDSRVEISRDPVSPGESLRVFIFQKGSFPIEKLTLRLLCQEEARYRQGTDTVTAKNLVHEETIVEREGLRADSGAPIMDADVAIPADAMHSFKSSNNGVRWLLELSLVIPGRPDVKDTFEFRVIPEVKSSWRV